MSEVTAVPLRPIAKGSLTKLWIGVAVVLAAAAGAAYVGTYKQVAMAQTPEDFLAANAKRSGVKVTASGLQYEVLKEGSGPSPTANDMVLVEYEGKLANGDIFDASARHGGPQPLPVAGGMIPGWGEGLQLMKQGAKYRFWMPPALAFGERGVPNGPIPPNAVAIFDVDLIAVAPPGAMGGMGGMGAGHGM
ncbi:FKBP-type peptidyl-prolyl cis-trans isomerase [Sphingomonas crocodyli]|uniref:Peptidyl-prolyl cis-trans isomerase n=1 Tax=Sphingomonas crocodyli TaxID=1979270 RepID=A0A437M8Z0_9SPHN|nr:FKBP-type peptidyl-prolyl cis-trans isomerase [Sphingomonas crocodyli]RVT93995.1 FKBP-type peptidyl-prolyl cis-trans isomerase [Sphingomonas crocodyli]